MGKTWNCTICTEQSFDRAIQLDGDNLCSKCIRHFFENAIISELNFPPRWGKRILDPRSFTDVLDADFLQKYEQKEEEWSLPPKLRVYCRNTDPPKRLEECGEFLGRRMESQECMRCDKCMWYTCLRCKECFSSPDSKVKKAVIEHECDPSADEERREVAFAGLERGKHYQDCPNLKCRRRVELKEACNHITCVCGAEFCYLCGQYAAAKSSHWTSGKCPRYGIYGHGIYDVNETREDQFEFEDDPVLEWQLQEIQDQSRRQEARFLQHARPAIPNGQVSRRLQEWPDRELHHMFTRPRDSRQGFDHSRNHHMTSQLRFHLFQGNLVLLQPRHQSSQRRSIVRHLSHENSQRREIETGHGIRAHLRQHHRAGYQNRSSGEYNYNHAPQ